MQQQSGLGVLDHEACVEATSKIPSKRKSYQKWSDKERYDIGKYASLHGPVPAAKKFGTKEKPLNESSARRFAKLYQEELARAKKQNCEVSKGLKILPRGRPLLLGSLDQMVQKFLLALRSRGGLVSSTIAISSAKALIARNPQLNLNHIDLDSSYWAQSLFRRMGFKRRLRTTGKVEIPEGARKEAELLFIHNIVSVVERYEIPDSLIMNMDQTPLKYVPAMNHTMAKRNSKSVAIAGSTDKRSITGTFVITLDGRFLPMQLIYGGKTQQSLPRFNFPDGFSLSCNPKHFSNTEESVKIIKEVLLPYIEDQRKKLRKPNQTALLTMDVFRGQITDDVTSLLTEHNVHVVLVPNNMTHLFQPLDLTVNKHCKSFLKRLFSKWYSQQIENQLSIGKKIEEVDIKFTLTTIKPLHAQWLVEFYNEMTSESGSTVIVNGWKASGIYDGLKMGSSNLPSIDPFQDISPLLESNDLESGLQAINITEEMREHFVNVANDEEDDSEWEDENDVDFNRNAFDIIIDDEE